MLVDFYKNNKIVLKMFSFWFKQKPETDEVDFTKDVVEKRTRKKKNKKSKKGKGKFLCSVLGI